jgi:hypothetical protein
MKMSPIIQSTFVSYQMHKISTEYAGLAIKL